MPPVVQGLFSPDVSASQTGIKPPPAPEENSSQPGAFQSALDDARRKPEATQGSGAASESPSKPATRSDAAKSSKKAKGATNNRKSASRAAESQEGNDTAEATSAPDASDVATKPADGDVKTKEKTAATDATPTPQQLAPSELQQSVAVASVQTDSAVQTPTGVPAPDAKGENSGPQGTPSGKAGANSSSSAAQAAQTASVPQQAAEDQDADPQPVQTQDKISAEPKAESMKQTAGKRTIKTKSPAIDQTSGDGLPQQPAIAPTTSSQTNSTGSQTQPVNDATGPVPPASSDKTDSAGDVSASPSSITHDFATVLDASTTHATSQSADPASKSAVPQPASVAPEVQFAESNHAKIVQQIHGQLLPSGGSMQIRLDPPELGALSLTVRMHEGVMTASFQTSNEEATRLLSHSLSDLKTSLESQGVSVGRLHVEQAPKDPQPQSRQDGQSRSDQSQDSPARQEQQRREMIRRMWQKLRGVDDPLDMVA